jgi:helix-turn-helix protein
MVYTAQPFVWLNSTEACRHLGIDRPTLRKMRESGLPHHPAGSAGFLYEAHSLDAWLAAHESVRRPARVSRYAPAGG